MRNKVVQISLFDIYTDVLDAAEENKSEFIRLMEEHIDLTELIPARFYHAFYSWTGRKRIHSLESFIKALLLQRILGIDSVALLRTILALSKELKDYCGFITIPDAPQFSRFKSEFEIYIEAFFEHLVDFTAPICRELDEKKSQYLIYDTTGIEACVKENNDKFFNTLLKQAKAMAKGNPNCDPYKLVYALFPDTAEKAVNAKHQYVNGHFCYAYKAGIVTDGLGIIRHISFFDDDFREKHPEVNTPKSDNPDIDKEIGDSTALKPVLSDFFEAHPDLKYHTFLGDSAFDSYDNYSMLKNEFHFERACIPLNKRNSQSSHTDFNEFGNPVCPLNGEQFICLGKTSGSVPNLFRTAPPENASAKRRAPTRLTEDASIHIQIKTSATVREFRATRSIGTTSTSTASSLRELSIFSRILSDSAALKQEIRKRLKRIYTSPAALN